MRSAETSGAGAIGFGAAQERGNARISRGMPSANPGRPQTTRISPITLAVALTALMAATLFTLYDTVRTFEDSQRDFAVVGSAFAAKLIQLAPHASVALASPLGDTGEMVQEVDEALMKPALPRPAPMAGDASDLWAGVAQRGLVAFALAGLMIGLTWRRGDRPDAMQRDSYRTLAAAIPLGVACWTRDGELVVCNEQYRDNLKLGDLSVSYQEAVRRLILGGYMKLINDDDRNRLLELHRQDGSCLLIDERPLADGGFLTLVSDVTEAKRTDNLLSAIREEQRLLARRYHEEKLKAEAASRSKTAFLAHLSHDIRTPLNHIIGFAELMRHQTYGPLGDPRYEDYVLSIKSSGERLLASFATILDLAELESGQKALRSDPVSVDMLLDQVAQRFQAQAARAGITLALGEPCEAVVTGDRMGLTRMVSNIVENSLRFTPHGGQISLAAFAARDGVVVEITDTGLGMSEERLASLSQPFALGDATFTREGTGPGLGIPIARAIAELSGGRMAIDSAPSLGTTVAISLPLQERQMRVAAE